MPYDGKPYPATFGQTSSKSDVDFGRYYILTLIPYNLENKIFQKSA